MIASFVAPFHIGEVYGESSGLPGHLMSNQGHTCSRYRSMESRWTFLPVRRSSKLGLKETNVAEEETCRLLEGPCAFIDRKSLKRLSHGIVISGEFKGRMLDEPPLKFFGKLSG